MADFKRAAPWLTALMPTARPRCSSSLAVDKRRDQGTGAAFIDYLSDSMLLFTAVFVIGMIASQVLPRLLAKLSPPAQVPAEVSSG